MRNVTVKLSDEAADWIRIRAAECRTSVSQLLGEMVAERMREASRYEAARRYFITRKLRPLTQTGESYPTREEIHDRTRLR